VPCVYTSAKDQIKTKLIKRRQGPYYVTWIMTYASFEVCKMF